jgi:hypothetical protein
VPARRSAARRPRHGDVDDCGGLVGEQCRHVVVHLRDAVPPGDRFCPSPVGVGDTDDVETGRTVGRQVAEVDDRAGTHDGNRCGGVRRHGGPHLVGDGRQLVDHCSSPARGVTR